MPRPGNAVQSSTRPPIAGPVRKACLVAASIAVLGLVGCGGGSKTNNPASPAANPSTPELASPLAGAPWIVSELQLELQSLGYNPGTDSGNFDAATQRALRGFQEATGVNPEEYGAVGPRTAISLQSHLAGRSSTVEALQSALTDVGLFSGTIDGQYGPDTLTAVRTLQRQTHVNVDGLFGPATAKALDVWYGRNEPESGLPTTTVPTSIPSTTSSPPHVPTTAPRSPDVLMLGAKGPAVTQLQQRLVALGYRPGPADGVFGSATVSAVLAFEKRNGLTRDGQAGPQLEATLSHPDGAGPRSMLPVPHVEVDLSRQIAFVVLPGQPVITLNVSTGNGASYHQPGGGTAVAFTPAGSFKVERKIAGDERAPLGTLHNPLYFYKGWAIHGSANVPAYPASHGCVRVSYSDADWLFPLLPLGTVVVIYDSAMKNVVQTAIPANAAPGF